MLSFVAGQLPRLGLPSVPRLLAGNLPVANTSPAPFQKLSFQQARAAPALMATANYVCARGFGQLWLYRLTEDIPLKPHLEAHSSPAERAPGGIKTIRGRNMGLRQLALQDGISLVIPLSSLGYTAPRVQLIRQHGPLSVHLINPCLAVALSTVTCQCHNVTAAAPDLVPTSQKS